VTTIVLTQAQKDAVFADVMRTNPSDLRVFGLSLGQIAALMRFYEERNEGYYPAHTIAELED
jgi:hypothetical protein